MVISDVMRIESQRSDHCLDPFRSTHRYRGMITALDREISGLRALVGAQHMEGNTRSGFMAHVCPQHDLIYAILVYMKR